MDSFSESSTLESSESLSEISMSEEDAQSSKRLKAYHHRDGIDMISDLPDVVLHHILSFIDMKDVIYNTSLISRRWRNLWISLPFLKFDNSLWNGNGKQRSINFIDNVLIRRDDSAIKKLYFRVSCGYNGEYAKRVDGWMTLAARRHVEEVHLDIDIDDLNKKPKQWLPDLVFKSSHIQVLKLRNCGTTRLLLSNSFCLAPKLKILEIYHIDLPPADSNKQLVLECLSLENLRIHCCNHKLIPTLLICAPQLKKLVLENETSYCNNGSCKLKISTPNLKSLVLKGSLYEEYSLQHVPSLECAKFESPAELDADMLIKVLDGLCNVRALELLGESKLTSIRSLDILDQLIHPFVNLRSLKINEWSCSSCIPTIHTLLTSSHCLETLTMGINQVGEPENWGELFQCISRLKSIEIKGLKGCEDELKFFEFVLKNAAVLEYVTLYIHERCCSLYRKEELAEFYMKIHSLPRAMSTVKILPFILA